MACSPFSLYRQRATKENIMSQDSKAYYQAHKEEIKARNRAWREANKEKVKAKKKEWYQAHKEEHRARCKAWQESHKEEVKEYQKEYQKTYSRTHKVPREKHNARMKAWREANKEKSRGYYRDYNKEYYKYDVNSSGKTKHSIRCISNQYLNKYGTKIPDYQIHHCCTYDEPYKFIYCSKETHRIIHAYLREHNIDADSDHYEQIKHLLDDTVVLYGIKEGDK